LILSIPILILSSSFPKPINWLLPLGAALIPYGIGVWFLPTGIGWSAPLLFTLQVWMSPVLLQESYVKGLSALSKTFPPLPQLLLGLEVGTVALVLSSLLGFVLLKQQLSLAQNWLVLGSASSVLIGAGIGSSNLLISSLLAGLVGFFVFILRDSIEDDSSDVVVIAGMVVIGVASVIAGGIASVVIGGAVGGIVVVVAVVATVVVTFGVGGIIAYGVLISFSFSIFSVIAFFIGFGIFGIITFSIAFVGACVVASVVAFGVAIVSQLPLLSYLISCAIVALGFAPIKKHS
jgi:hypothetical protein